MGLILAALFAGTYPAINPEKIKIIVAPMTIPGLTLGSLIKYVSSKLLPIALNIYVPNVNPKYLTLFEMSLNGAFNREVFKIFIHSKLA